MTQDEVHHGVHPQHEERTSGLQSYEALSSWLDGPVQVFERTSLVPLLLVLSFTEERMLDSPDVIMDYLPLPHSSTSFHFKCFEILLLGE